MNATGNEFDHRGLAGQVTETAFSAVDLPTKVHKKLKHDRYAWLTTVAPNGVPVPMLVWFGFDGNYLTVYTQPHTSRVTHVFEHPEVSLHLDSDGVGSGLIIIGGRAAVTAESVDPREDKAFWAKYHVEAEALGLAKTIGSYSARITITPTTLWTTHVA
ncbi:MAG: pyridoxamine 5'-phosphate oxidase family protein [Mycobacterium sp.]|nr:pyridoxamine 5'-phosphate oxidase family protein [Mycobacterium sp.]